jgi:hypothetical protein
MLFVLVGALLVILGVVLMATRTLRRGRLSEVHRRPTDVAPDTLEPSGTGRRLDIKADLPGLGLIVLGSLILLAGAIRAG